MELIARYAGHIDSWPGIARLHPRRGRRVWAWQLLTIREAGKAAGESSVSTSLGSARMEIRPQSVREGQRVLIIDVWHGWHRVR